MLVVAPLVGAVSLPFTIAYLGAAAAIGLFLAQTAEGLSAVMSNILRAQGRPKLYAMTEGGRNFAVLIVTMACVFASLPWVKNPAQLLLTRALLTATTIAIVVLTRRIVLEPARRTAMTDMLQYGWPILAAQLFQIVALNADRYVVGLAGLPRVDLTTYVVHNRLAAILNLALLSPLALWFPVEAMRRDTTKHADFFNGVLALFVAGFLVVLLSMELVTPLFWSYLFPQVRLNLSLLAAAICTLGLQGLAVVWNIGALRSGYTRWNIAPPIISMVVMVAAGWALGRAYGLLGLAAARIVASAAYAVCFRVISQRIAPVPTDPFRLTPFIGGIAAIILVPELLKAPNNALGVVAAAMLATAGLASVTFGLWLNRVQVSRALSPGTFK
jgi:hypothetical protein